MQFFKKCLILCAVNSFAQVDVDLSGKILDGNNAPVPSVEIEVESLGLRDTTDAQGMWSIKSATSAVSPRLSQALDARVVDNELTMYLSQSTMVRVEMLDQSGSRISILGSQNMAAGEHRVALDRILPYGQYYVRVWAGDASRTFAVVYSSPTGRIVASPTGMAATITDKLVYRLQGQILTAEQISKYQQYIEKFIQIRNISGVFAPGTTTIRQVYADFSGGAMPLSAQVRLGWLASTNKYSGKVYSVKPLGSDVYNYSVFAYGLDSLGHKTTQSLVLPFDSYVGDLELQDAKAGNALPRLSVVAQDTLSINDSLWVSVADTDDFGGQVKIKEVRFNGGSWQNAMAGRVGFVVPSDSGLFVVQARVMDDDSNWNFSAKSVVVTKGVPVVGIEGASPLAINTESTYSAVVQDRYGDSSKFQYQWDTGSGYQVGSKQIQVKWLTSGVHALGLKVTDDDGVTQEYIRSINVTNDAPLAVGLANANVNKGDQLTFRVAVSDPEGVKKVIWDFGHGGVGNPRLDTTTRSDSSIVTHLWDGFGEFTVKMTVIDNFDQMITQTVVVKVFDWFNDDRDGQRYRRVQIGNQVWMAENLKYVPAGKDGNGAWCYNNSVDSCQKYGRLYNWTTAMAGANSSHAVPSGVQGICPIGWHLPSDEEWEILPLFIATNTGLNGQVGEHWSQIGKLLKANSASWIENTGTDQFGFSALPAGAYNSGNSFDLGTWAFFWSSTAASSNSSYDRQIDKGNDAFYKLANPKTSGFSVRCVQDSLSLVNLSSDTVTINDSIPFSINVGSILPQAVKYEWDNGNTGVFVTSTAR